MSCDESKCVSKGNSVAFNDSFTCYGDGMFYPMMCADGYLPVTVDDEPPLVVSDKYFGQVSLSYFTCCPPDNVYAVSNATTTSDVVIRHCSDPITADRDSLEDENFMDEICDDRESQTHARRQKIGAERLYTPFGGMVGLKDDSILCCDSKQDIGANDDYLLEELDCVPYRNEFYWPAMTFNLIGVIDVVVCDIAEFPYARPVFGDDADFVGPVYQCCRDGPSLPPFVHDSGYQITAYTFFALSCIVAFLSAFLTVALLIPLWKQPKHSAKTRSGESSSYQSKLSIPSVRSISVFVSSSLRSKRLSQEERNLESVRQSVRGRRGELCYSTYNLYLVSLVISDLIYFSIEVVLFGSTMNQKWYPNFFPGLVVPASSGEYAFDNPFDNKISYTYLAANMWINAIICYQILTLLQTSRRAKRIRQPSIEKVNWQIGTVYGALSLCGVALYFLFESALEAGHNRDLERQSMFASLSLVLMAAMMLPPFLYVIYASISIWWNGYIPSWKGAAPKARAMRQLAFFFFRIVAVFIGIWLPVFMLLALALQLEKYWLLALAYWLTAVQPILTFLMVLTKSDTRKYIWDLVTLSYLFDRNNSTNLSRNDSKMGQKDSGVKNDAKMAANDPAVMASGATADSSLSNSGAAISGAEDTGPESAPDLITSVTSSEEDDEETLLMSVLGFSASFQPPPTRRRSSIARPLEG